MCPAPTKQLLCWSVLAPADRLSVGIHENPMGTALIDRSLLALVIDDRHLCPRAELLS